MSHRPIGILALGAHPDDVEIGCAGTLARCIQRGDKVTIAVLCQGDAASMGMTREQLVAARRKEARAAARFLGAELLMLGISDFGVEVTLRNKQRLAAAIRRARPDVVITHFHSDYGADHNHACALAVDATLAASVAAFPAKGAPIPRTPLLFMMEPLGGHGFLPQVYVDITATLDTKIRMFAHHRSQVAWMASRGGLEMREYMTTIARFRGYQSGVKYAEGFIPHPSFGHIGAGPVLP